MLSSRARKKVLYPGAVTTQSGQYRVSHSKGHQPVAETFLRSGVYLPQCPVRGCVVSFELLFHLKDEFELKRLRAAC